jgi:hypothetical protein
MFERTGGCICGAVRFVARGEPKRVGLCHCLTCRKESGSAFVACAIYDAPSVTWTGATRSWSDKSGHRHFCPMCGSRLFGTDDAAGEVEVRLGALDEAPGDLVPTYELWAVRREEWLPATPHLTRYEHDRVDAG